MLDLTALRAARRRMENIDFELNIAKNLVRGGWAREHYERAMAHLEGVEREASAARAALEKGFNRLERRK